VVTPELHAKTALAAIHYLRARFGRSARKLEEGPGLYRIDVTRAPARVSRSSTFLHPALFARASNTENRTYSPALATSSGQGPTQHEFTVQLRPLTPARAELTWVCLRCWPSAVLS